MEYRFWDKAHLSSYSLDTKIFDSYDFTVSDASPIRSVFSLSTNEGYKIFKKINYSLEELKFIHSSLEKIREEYPYIVQFKPTKDGEPYVVYNNDIYVVLDLIEGRECIFENPIDLENAAAGLAKYHKAAEKVDTGCAIRNNNYKMISNFKDMIRKMDDFRRIASMHVNKSEFDTVFLENYEYHKNQAQDALKRLVDSPYRKLCGLKSTLCHQDLAYHNIIMGNDGNVYFIDFDYVIIDLPYHDLANLISKASKYNGWSTEAFDRIFSAYASVNGFDTDEKCVLYAYMLFPYDFFSISNFYYSKIKDWEEEEYLEKLIRKISSREEREGLLTYMRSK